MTRLRLPLSLHLHYPAIIPQLFHEPARTTTHGSHPAHRR
nr:MAG TPA: hypothetical protein [Caudoviricetes sp.]